MRLTMTGQYDAMTGFFADVPADSRWALTVAADALAVLETCVNPSFLAAPATLAGSIPGNEDLNAWCSMRAEVAPDANLAMTGPLSSLTTFAAWGHTIAHSACDTELILDLGVAHGR